jgi:hypothetical protein
VLESGRDRLLHLIKEAQVVLEQELLLVAQLVKLMMQQAVCSRLLHLPPSQELMEFFLKVMDKVSLLQMEIKMRQVMAPVPKFLSHKAQIVQVGQVL